MRTSTRILVGLSSAALILGGTATAHATTVGLPGGTGTTLGTQIGTATVDDDAAADLRFSREEERMARDLYAALDAHHDGMLPFSRITLSEQRHFAAMGRLLEAFGLDDPSQGLEPGTYADPQIQAMYDGWYSRGITSPGQAFQVGIELETADIADLEEMIERSDDAWVDQVLGNLLAGSRNHLAAFQAAADGRPVGGGQGQGQHFQAPDREGRAPGQQQRGHGPGAGQGQGPGDGTGDCPYTDSDG